MIEATLEDFVRDNLPALRRYAYALTGDRHGADDLVQDTLLRVAKAWRRSLRQGNPVGFATTVMFRTHISGWRRRRRRPVLRELTIDPASPSDAYSEVDTRAMLDGALETLPRLQRAVLVATYLGDLSDDTIATMIDRAPSSVRSLRHRGLQALRAALGPDRLAVDMSHTNPTETEVHRGDTGIFAA